MLLGDHLLQSSGPKCGSEPGGYSEVSFLQNYRGLGIWVITFALCIAQRFLPLLIMTIVVLTTALISCVPFQRNSTDLGTTVHPSGRGAARRAGAKVLGCGEGPTLHADFQLLEQEVRKPMRGCE